MSHSENTFFSSTVGPAFGEQPERPAPDILFSSIALGSNGSTITGNAEPLSLVTVSKADRVIGEAISSYDGTWSMPWLGSRNIDVHSLTAASSRNHRPAGHDHGTPVSAGAPSIAAISDTTQGSHGKFSRAATIDNPLPTIIGFGHAGDIVTILDGDHSIGSTTVHSDGTWAFSTPLLSKGSHDFCVIAVSSVSGVTLMSNHLVVKMIGDSTPVALAVATIDSALDEFTDPSGHLHQTVIQNGGNTPDTSPKLVGTLSAALHEGDVLYIYRDGQKLGPADVSGNTWSFQDAGVAAGSHAYTAHVETAAGAHGANSSEFSLTKAELTGSPDKLPVLVGENFLMVDIRLMRATTSNGLPMTFDLEESVKFMKLQGLDVKSYSQNQDFITFEVDWMSYATGHLNDNLMFVWHQHVDNASGGLDYYATVGLAPFTELLRQLGGWIPTTLLMDGAAMQSPLPPVDVHIGGVYDGLMLVPDGGSTSGTTHTLVGTLSGTISHTGAIDYGYIVIYRDGVKIAASTIGFRSVTVDGTEWTFEDRDVPPGPHVYTAQIARTYGKQGTMSEGYHIVETVETSLAVATITSALDEFTDPAGNHHDNVIQNGGKTFDTSPKLLGTLDAALNAGETLVVYRDGVKVGLAEVSGLGWSFQDMGVAIGEHTYRARVESATGAQGAESANFGIVEAVPYSLDRFPMLLTDNFLIFDTRGISRMTSDGEPVTFDLLEGVRLLEANGMTVKSYTDKDGFISIEVDWMSYLKAHPDPYPAFDFVAHRHIANGKGGLDLYDLVGTPLFTPFGNMLDTWIPTFAVADGRMQPATPPAATFITGIYDVYTDKSGNPAQSLIPNGGSTSNSTHKIVLTFSEPLQQGWIPDQWEIYRDGVRLLPNKDLLEIKYDQATNTGWVIETNVPPGEHEYTARVPRAYGEQGAWSEAYSIVETAPDPVAVATITSALDEFIDPNGNHHDQVIQASGKTADTSPQLHGTLSAALHEGEVLAIYRDGQKIGTASVLGLGWSYQDDGLTKGQHVYTASVVSASGEQGVHSDTFQIIETAGTGSGFQLLATEDFLIFDTRFEARATSDGKVVSVDMLEGVRMLEKAGMTVKSYTDNNGVISIEVDWVEYTKAHSLAYLDLNLHRHIDTDQGGLNYYNLIAVPDFPILLNLLGSWVPANFVIDASGKSPTPAAAATITGVFDSYVDDDGHAQFARIPAGGTSDETSHRIEGTVSEPMNKWSDSLVIYRDGEKLTGDAHAFDSSSNYSNTTWWIIDNDVPPGPHVYTARVERAFEAQGPWSQSYGILELAHEPIQESFTARMLMNDHLLIVDTGIQSHTTADGSAASMQVKAELTLAGGSVAVFQAAVDKNGTASFEADWARIITGNPKATLTITAQDTVNQSDQVVDKHVVGSLAGQIGRWVTATPDGESAIFFDGADRSTHIHGNAGINTITIADDHQLIDLTSLTGKTVGSTITGIERIDLGGQHNTLKIAMIDVLNLGETDLFRIDGKQQLMVNGKAGDFVNLSNTRVAGIADGEWAQQAETKIGGVAYDVYEHSTAHVELIVQQGVQLTMH